MWCCLWFGKLWRKSIIFRWITAGDLSIRIVCACVRADALLILYAERKWFMTPSIEPHEFLTAAKNSFSPQWCALRMTAPTIVYAINWWLACHTESQFTALSIACVDCTSMPLTCRRERESEQENTAVEWPKCGTVSNSMNNQCDRRKLSSSCGKFFELCARSGTRLSNCLVACGHRPCMKRLCGSNGSRPVQVSSFLMRNSFRRRSRHKLTTIFDAFASEFNAIRKSRTMLTAQQYNSQIASITALFIR